jgi:hypothetical protein
MLTTIRNETPCNLELIGTDSRNLMLSPLEVRQIKQDDLAGFDLSEAVRAGLINKWTEPPSEAFEKTAAIGFGAGFALLVVCSIAAGFKPPFLKAIWPQFVWTTGVTFFLLIVVIAALTITKSLRPVLSFLAQSITLIFILAIGLGFRR